MSQPDSKAVNTVIVDGSRSQTHAIVLNVQEQVERKIQHAGKSVMKVEMNDEEIKIKNK